MPNTPDRAPTPDRDPAPGRDPAPEPEPEHAPDRRADAHRSSARRQWTILGVAAAVVIAAVLVVATVVVPRLAPEGSPMTEPTRNIIHRKTAAQAFPGGLAVQPASQNQPGRRETDARNRGDVTTADAIAQIAQQPIATWLANPSTTATRDTIRSVVASAEQSGATPTFVLYAVPDRDCGSYSKGGTTTSQYIPWVRAAVRAMRGSHAVVLVEPDSIAQISNCKRLEHGRLPLLRRAVAALAGHGLTVYLDGGNENRVPTATMAQRLRAAGIDDTQGFFTNVSNFYRVDTERAYADALADRIGGDPHFVIDVSRNGNGWRGTWCNPAGAGLGQTPRVTGGTTRLDALLWVKTPGLSDGTCNGGPAAGQWWESYALDLVRNRKQE